MNLRISPEVASALAARRAVVALESTVIAHGLPRPQNVETAIRCEAAILAAGAVPATIAILDGELRVGLARDEIERLAAGGVRKASRRELPIAVALKLDCATTVATTAFIANKAGIRVFATGGIGGVHRGFEADISADLPELTQTPITVVCSGAKIVLDLERTREWLETYGISVLGWHCDEMPAFYSRTSGLPVDESVTDADAAAAVIRSRDELGLSSALLVTVPVPQEYEIAPDDLEAILQAAIGRANEQGVKGKNLTPFLLSEMSAASGGRTLAANIALLENNARVAGEIAVALGRAGNY